MFDGCTLLGNSWVSDVHRTGKCTYGCVCQVSSDCLLLLLRFSGLPKLELLMGHYITPRGSLWYILTAFVVAPRARCMILGTILDCNNPNLCTVCVLPSSSPTNRGNDVVLERTAPDATIPPTVVWSTLKLHTVPYRHKFILIVASLSLHGWKA